MKKSIKAIAAALSAAVLCALPVANSMSADAAYITKKSFRITYVSTRTNLHYTGIRLNANKASGMNFSTQSLGFVNNGRLMGGSVSGNSAYTNWCSTVPNGLGEVGILADWYINTTNMNRTVANISGSTNKSYIDVFKVRLGDLTGARNNTEDGIDVSDAIAVYNLIDHYYVNAPTENIKSYMLSSSYNSLDKGILRMMLAADINGDDKVSECEATIILRHAVGINGYDDLEHFLSWSVANMEAYNASH